MNLTWNENGTISIDPPKKPKKITGTRFAAIMGLNTWSTPFKAWCEITRVYQDPFVDTIYTRAGTVIEPKQAEYMKQAYFMPNLIKPADVWGEDYFKVTRGDFFPENEILGGMWDYKLIDGNGRDSTVLEMKTSKRSEDWKDDVPEYYALQAALYAYLLGVDDVIMVASFLQASDYDDPENFVPSAANTITVPFKVSERYPDFPRYVAYAENWWKAHVVEGLSPAYDERKDADILKALRTAHVDTSTSDAAALAAEAEALKVKIDTAKENISADEKRYKAIMDAWKHDAIKQLGTPGVDIVSIPGTKMTWTVNKRESMELDTEAMKADGVYEKYLTKSKIAYSISCKSN